MPRQSPRGNKVPTSGIRERADELVRLHEDLDRTYAARDGSEPSVQAWSIAAAAFNEATAAFYEPFTGLGHRIRAGDQAAIDEAVRFLEADPWCFRSGYTKEELMTALANAPVSERTRARLRDVVLKRLKHREPRLLRPTGRLAAKVWDDTLARQVNTLKESGTDAEREDAAALIRAVEHNRKTRAGSQEGSSREVDDKPSTLR